MAISFLKRKKINLPLLGVIGFPILSDLDYIVHSGELYMRNDHLVLMCHNVHI